MNIPNKVKVGGAIYTVEQSDNILAEDTQQCKGLVNHDMHIINICTSVQDVQGCEQTFLHELVHAIVNDHGIEFNCSNDESITEELAKGLHQVIIDNPDIFR